MRGEIAMKYRRTIIAATLGLLCISALWIMGAATTDGGPPIVKLIRAKVANLRAFGAGVNLTVEQLARVQAIRAKHSAEIAAAAAHIVENKRALRDATLAQNPDPQAIRKAADDLGQAIGNACVLASQLLGEGRGLLTEEQAARVRDLLASKDAAEDAWLQTIGAKAGQ
jgi:Spy/CpxP family protein refolding chaperone